MHLVYCLSSYGLLIDKNRIKPPALERQGPVWPLVRAGPELQVGPPEWVSVQIELPERNFP